MQRDEATLASAGQSFRALPDNRTVRPAPPAMVMPSAKVLPRRVTNASAGPHKSPHFGTALSSGALLLLAFILGFAALSACTETQKERGKHAPPWFATLRGWLSPHGILIEGEGLQVDGWTFKARRLDVFTARGAVRLRHLGVQFGLAHEWGWGFRPAVSLHVANATVVHKTRAATSANSQPSPSAALGATPPGVPLALFVLVDHLHIGAHPQVVSLAARVGSNPGEWIGRFVVAGASVGTQKAWRVLGQAKKHGATLSGSLLAPDVPVTVAAALGIVPPKLQIESGVVHALADFSRDEKDGVLYLKAGSRVDSLCVEQPRLGEGRACGIKVEGVARLALSSDEIFFEAMKARLNGIAVEVSGHVPRDKDGEYDLSVRVPPQPVQGVLGAIPPRWRTGAFGLQLAGTLEAKVALVGPGDDLSITPEFTFRRVSVLHAAPGQDPRDLSGPTDWTLTFPYGVPRHVYLGRSDPHFTPISATPSVLAEAIRMSEDASFLWHDGFDRHEIGKAILDLKDGGRPRGASTLTQQLAKNLFFDGDRNLSRKIEEAVVTSALEASVTKTRLFEIYINVVEWGDGVYGIGAAARHYFNKFPWELDGKESAFLAAILPAPRRVDHELRYSGESAFAKKRVARLMHFLCNLQKASLDDCEDQSGYVETAAASLNP